MPSAPSPRKRGDANAGPAEGLVANGGEVVPTNGDSQTGRRRGDAQASPVVKRRGAPLGNSNAMKHGFYSSRFRKSELTDLESTDTTALRDEIAMLRVCIRRAMEWSANIRSLSDATNFLRVVALASASLSRLVRTQKLVAGSEMETAFQTALEEVAIELGLAGPPDPPPTSGDSSLDPAPTSDD